MDDLEKNELALLEKVESLMKPQIVPDVKMGESKPKIPEVEDV